MNPRPSTDFQNGIIDLFKIHRIFELNITDCQKKGDVTSELDKDLGRKIIKICGNLGPGNNLTIPNPKHCKSLLYYGTYYYIFYKAFIDKKFSFCFTYVYDNSDTFRFTFKFPLKEIRAYRTNVFNVEVPIDVNENNTELWTLYKFDPANFITQKLSKYKDFSAFNKITSDNLIFKSFEVFSTIYLHGVYISKQSFDNLDSLPKEMSVRTLNNRPVAQLLFIDGNTNSQYQNVQNVSNKSKSKEKNKNKSNNNNNYNNNINNINNKQYGYGGMNYNDNNNRKYGGQTGNNRQQQEFFYTNEPYNESVGINNNNYNNNNYNNNYNNNINNNYGKKSNQQNNNNNYNKNPELRELESGLLTKNMNHINKEFIENKKETLRNLFKKDEQRKLPLLPDPMMNLNYIIGYTAQKCPFVIYNSHGDYDVNPNVSKDDVNPTKKHMYFCSGTNLIKFDPFNIKQKFFLGHSKPITNFITACKGEIIFSSQEGTNSLIRVWKTSDCSCYKMLTTPFDKLKVMTENKTSKYLCTVGIEQNKESILVWNIENLDNITVYIRQSVPTPINSIKFSPFEESNLVSCGRENIKFWRIKNDHLSGKAVVLNKFARDNEFLCLDFNNTIFGDDNKDKGKVYIGSTGGCIFQVACGNQELEAVYKVQDSAILALAVNEAFCATGSKDGYLRIWPVDFSEFLIEAKHDTGVCSVDISYDALDILCGTLGGSIGILNVQNKEYKTILRSPPNIIKHLVIHPSGSYLFTIEGDNSIRIWDIEHKAEAFQFVSTKDPPLCVAAPQSLTFACGFSSGIVKIFDLEKTEVLYECKPFKSSLNHLLFIQKDKLLVSMSSQGNISLHDCLNNYIQIKLINIDTPAVYTDISLSIEGDYFSTIGSESNCALVWNSVTFGMKNRVPINNFFIKKLCLINKNLLGCVLDNCNIRFYALSAYQGVFIKEIPNMHINNINQFICSHNLKYLLSSGEEGMIKIWDMKMIFKPLLSYQQFIGHSSGIRGLILLENKGLVISTSETSGIYFWNFLGDTTFTETEIIQEIEKLNVPSHIKMLNEKSALNSTSGGKSINIRSFNKNDSQQQQSGNKKQYLTKDIRNNYMDKVYRTENEKNSSKNLINPSYEIITKGVQENEENKNNDFYEYKILAVSQEGNEETEINYDNTSFGINEDTLYKYDTSNIKPDSPKNQEIMNKILFKSRYVPDKLEKFLEPEITSEKLKQKYCLGLSVNTMNNIVFNKINKWYAYTVNNKIIIEFLENERKQVIISDSKDELSCLIMSQDGKHLISAVGCTNREEYAPIFVYETFGFSLRKKLNFHFKGIQHITISQDNKYMVSIGTLEEKSICVWNFTNLTVIDSKGVKYNPYYAVCLDVQQEKNFHFITIAQHVLSFWRINDNFKMESNSIPFEDLTNKRTVGEYITGITLSPQYDQIKKIYVLISTNKGSIMIVDSDTKCFLEKYEICKYPLTKIFFVGEHFVCAGEVPIVYGFKFNPNKVKSGNYNILNFLSKEKRNFFALDGAVNSMTLSESGEEGLITTDNGSIFFLNFEGGNALKIISSHENCKIQSLDCDKENQNLLSSGGDGGVRCWLINSFDQRFLLQKMNQKPNKLILKENILIIQFEYQYLSLYNMNSLKSIGKIYIPKEEILYFDLIFNNSLLLITKEKNVYIIDIKNWEPLSVLFTELVIKNNVFPKNQNCNSLNCLSLGNEKSYATFSFADGTICTFMLKKVDNSKVNIILVDKYNMIEIYMNKNEDKNIKEMYNNMANYRNDYKTISMFSNHSVEVILSFHENLQFLFIRNFYKKETIKLIPLNYFPFSLALSDEEKYIAVGTKEGLILFITRSEDNYNSCFNLDIFKGHYDTVDSIKFSHDTKNLFSTSQNELFVWDIMS